MRPRAAHQSHFMDRRSPDLGHAMVTHSPGPARPPGRYGGDMPADRQETPVVLSRIYTRTGDDGTTALGDGSRAAKTDPRLAAYADVDEANCAIGAAVTMGGLPPRTCASCWSGSRTSSSTSAPTCATRVDATSPPTRRCGSATSYIDRAGAGLRPVQRGPAGAAELRAARRQPRRRAAAHGQDRGPAGRAQRLGGHRGARRRP